MGRRARPCGGESVSGSATASSWSSVAHAFRETADALPPPWEAIFGPLRQGMVDDLVLVGQSGQSIDARIATSSGHSHYINGEAGLVHLHRLRALVDAVVIGVGTAIADDPQLTVRRVEGPSPARVILDPNGRLPPTARVLAADGIRRVVITAGGSRGHLPEGVDVIQLAANDGGLAPAAIITALAALGFRRMLIEGGANTVSRFLAAHCLDRLHVLVAPIILGDGRASLTLPPIDRVDEAIRTPMHAHTLGDAIPARGGDVLLDCDLSAHRMAIGRAKMST
ncbi:MAG: diaminohydroxyphosphoribosylaminopyrimidine deaminase [Alphaproteobacteria bacterium]|jgi:diaminohydroxyphosphoribosylaminopyrimidine deaminase/5-amino-6-(5-phosphoribosylamino)uracil reductase|nr:diaminohydroxyphosphoribosylaminopyrimidine deaminase [Alphaproteobacteria bacterium]